MQKKIKFGIWLRTVMAITTLLFLHVHSCPAREKDLDQQEDLIGRKVSEIVIEISGIFEKNIYWEQVARDLIIVKEKDVFSFEKIKKSVSRLVESGLFQTIHVKDPIKTSQGVRLSFAVTPFGRVKNIVIKNAFPLFQKEILNVLSLQAGDVFSEENLKGQAERVTTLLREEGYTDPQVNLSALKDEADGNYTIAIHIEKDAYFKIDQVDFKGNQSISATVLKLRIKTWKASILVAGAGRFVQKDLNEDVKNIISFYRGKGFFDVQVEAEIVKNKPEMKLDILFRIQEGPKYIVSFQGNDHFSDYTLKKEIAHLFKSGNKNNFGVKKALRNLKRLYSENAYPDADIESRVIHDDPQAPLTHHLIFIIDEGRQYRVTTLEMSGNRMLLKEDILKTFLTHGAVGVGESGAYVPEVLEEDIRTMTALYTGKGYTNIRVEKDVRIQKASLSDKTAPNTVEIMLLIEEGVQTFVDRVEILQLTAIPQDMALSFLSLKPGMAFDQSKIEPDEKILQEKISEAGYPHAVVKARSTFSENGAGVNLSFEVKEGPMVKIGRIIYSGNFKTKEKILAGEMAVHTGDPLSLSELLESRRKILGIHAVDSAKLKPVGLKTEDEDVPVVVEVAEKKPYVFEAGAGFDTERHVYLNTLVGDRNFKGLNLDLKAEAEISQIGYQLDAALTDPRFLSTVTASTTRIYGEDREEFNKDFGTKTAGISQDFSRPFLDRKLTANLGVVYEIRDQYLSKVRALTESEEQSYTTRSIFVTSPGLVFNTTDSYVRPRQGVFTTLNLNLSKGIDNDMDDFIKYQAEGRYYYTPFTPLTLAVRGRYGFIQPYGGNARVPEDQLFYLGGASTVRGFDENLLRTDTLGQAKGGRESVLGSLEARYDLGMKFELSLFYDIGAVARTQGRDISESFRDSVGVGLRYITPVGPIGFLYGHKLDPEPHESPGSFHFSMGYTF